MTGVENYSPGEENGMNKNEEVSLGNPSTRNPEPIKQKHNKKLKRKLEEPHLDTNQKIKKRNTSLEEVEKFKKLTSFVSKGMEVLVLQLSVQNTQEIWKSLPPKGIHKTNFFKTLMREHVNKLAFLCADFKESGLTYKKLYSQLISTLNRLYKSSGKDILVPTDMVRHIIHQKILFFQEWDNLTGNDISAMIKKKGMTKKQLAACFPKCLNQCDACSQHHKACHHPLGYPTKNSECYYTKLRIAKSQTRMKAGKKK